jgi:hypothetical protein
MLDIIDNEKGLKNEKPFEADARNFAERIINNSVSNKYKWLKGTKTIFKQRKNEIESFKINDGIWKCIWEKNYLRYKQLLKNNEGTL